MLMSQIQRYSRFNSYYNSIVAGVQKHSIAILERAYEQEDASKYNKRIELYLRQKKTLELFLERNAISKEQFDKSLGDLTVKMGMEKNY